MKELVPYFCLEWNWGTNSCVGGTVQPLSVPLVDLHVKSELLAMSHNGHMCYT